MYNKVENAKKEYHNETIFLAANRQNLLQKLRIFHPTWHPKPYHLSKMSATQAGKRKREAVVTLWGHDEVSDVKDALNIHMAFVEIFHHPMIRIRFQN